MPPRQFRGLASIRPLLPESEACTRTCHPETRSGPTSAFASSVILPRLPWREGAIYRPRHLDPTMPTNAAAPQAVPPQILIAATFTATPLEEPLQFWLRELGLTHRVAFAPY